DLDPTRPTAVLLLGILHMIQDSEGPYEIVAQLMDALPSGSYLAISHPASDIHPGQAEAQRRYNERVSTPQTLRTRAEVSRFFEGLTWCRPAWATSTPGGPARTTSSPPAGGLPTAGSPARPASAARWPGRPGDRRPGRARPRGRGVGLGGCRPNALSGRRDDEAAGGSAGGVGGAAGRKRGATAVFGPFPPGVRPVRRRPRRHPGAGPVLLRLAAARPLRP